MTRLSAEELLFLHLQTASVSDFDVIRPDQNFDPLAAGSSDSAIRGTLLDWSPAIVGFGNGAYHRVQTVYQISIFARRDSARAFFELTSASEALTSHFYPDARGLDLGPRSGTLVEIRKRPSQRYLGEIGGFLHEALSIELKVEVPPQ